MGLFGKKKETPVGVGWPEEVLPNEGEEFAHAVSFYQNNLKALGKGRQRFALVGEPTNKADPHAVMVSAITPMGLAQVGYLQRGEYKTEHFQTLALRLEHEGKLLVAHGTIELYDGGLGVRIQLPRWQWLKARLAALPPE